MTDLALIIEPEELQAHLQDADILLIDMCTHNQYLKGHITGAVYLDYNSIVAINRPVAGLMPDKEHMSAVLSSLGLTADKHVIVYDDEGGGKASRLIYTLHAIGHTKTSLLNGGLISWANEGHALTRQSTQAHKSDYKAHYNGKRLLPMRIIYSGIYRPKMWLFWMPVAFRNLTA